MTAPIQIQLDGIPVLDRVDAGGSLSWSSVLGHQIDFGSV